MSRRPAEEGASGGGWVLYILRCRDGSLYTGVTNALERRLEAHAAGKASRYTRARLPVALAVARACASKRDALRLEWAVKRLARARKLALIGGVPARAWNDLLPRGPG